MSNEIAWGLANACNAAYEAKIAFNKGGYENVTSKNCPSLKNVFYETSLCENLRYFQVADVLDAALLGMGSKSIFGNYKSLVLSITGTATEFKTNPIQSILDWIINFLSIQMPYSILPFQAKVHSGFMVSTENLLITKYKSDESNNNGNSLLDDIVNTISSNKYNNIYITGQSQGGAMATLAAPIIHENIQGKANEHTDIKVYTFSSPIAGNRDFASYFSQYIGSSYRYKYAGDIVTLLPPSKCGFWFSLYESLKENKNSDKGIENIRSSIKLKPYQLAQFNGMFNKLSDYLKSINSTNDRKLDFVSLLQKFQDKLELYGLRNLSVDLLKNDDAVDKLYNTIKKDPLKFISDLINRSESVNIDDINNNLEKNGHKILDILPKDIVERIEKHLSDNDIQIDSKSIIEIIEYVFIGILFIMILISEIISNEKNLNLNTLADSLLYFLCLIIKLFNLDGENTLFVGFFKWIDEVIFNSDSPLSKWIGNGDYMHVGALRYILPNNQDWTNDFFSRFGDKGACDFSQLEEMLAPIFTIIGLIPPDIYNNHVLVSGHSTMKYLDNFKPDLGWF